MLLSTLNIRIYTGYRFRVRYVCVHRSGKFIWHVAYGGEKYVKVGRKNDSKWKTGFNKPFSCWGYRKGDKKDEMKVGCFIRTISLIQWTKSETDNLIKP